MATVQDFTSFAMRYKALMSCAAWNGVALRWYDRVYWLP